MGEIHPADGGEIDSLANDGHADAGSPRHLPSRLRGRRAGGAPGAELARDDTRRRPLALGEACARVSPASTRVGVDQSYDIRSRP